MFSLRYIESSKARLALLALIALLFGSSAGADDLSTITVKLRRKADPRYFADFPLELWVNGNNLGSVDSGRDVALKLLPVDSGSYTFCMVLTSWVNGNPIKNSSKKVDIAAPPGATIIADTAYAGSIALHLTLILPSPVRLLSAQLSNRYLERELSRETVDTPRGAKRTIRRSRTFERDVTVGTTTGLDSLAKANVAVLATEIRGKLEHTESQAYKEQETIEQTIEIDGSVLPKCTVAWVETRQVGTASAVINGLTTNIPFELARTLELRVLPLGK